MDFLHGRKPKHQSLYAETTWSRYHGRIVFAASSRRLAEKLGPDFAIVCFSIFEYLQLCN